MRAFLVAASLLLAGSLSVTAPVLAQGASPIMVEDAWSRPTLGQSKTGAAYLVLHNHGTAPDRLVGAASPVAARVELHNHVMEGSVMRMVHVPAIEVAPGSPTVLQPGGLHVMLFDVNKRFAAGDKFQLTLTFEKAGRIEVEVAVRAMGSMPAPMPTQGHQHHMGRGGAGAGSGQTTPPAADPHKTH